MFFFGLYVFFSALFTLAYIVIFGAFVSYFGFLNNTDFGNVFSLLECSKS